MLIKVSLHNKDARFIASHSPNIINGDGKNHNASKNRFSNCGGICNTFGKVIGIEQVTKLLKLYA